MILRKYRKEDYPALLRLFHDTVHAVNARDYTKPQLDAWAPLSMDEKSWETSFLRNFTIVAVKSYAAESYTAKNSARENNLITGFGDIDGSGYLNRLYVHKAHQGENIGNAICDILEAQSAKISKKITVHSSLTAKGFFEKRGYRIIKRQQVIRRGVFLTNFVMEKSLE